MKKILCAVRNCDSDKEKNPSTIFYTFPKDVNLRRKWLEALGMFDEQVNKRSKVCSMHFKKTDYVYNRLNHSSGSKAGNSNAKQSTELVLLKPSAVPSTNLPQKSTFKIKISKKDNNSKEIRVEEVKVKLEKDQGKDKIKQEMPAPKKIGLEARRASRTRPKKRRNSEVIDSSDSEEDMSLINLTKKQAAPVELLPPPRARTQSRRAASKEALKQMQLLLGDDDDTVEIPDDDAPPPLEQTPPPPRPKKTYKLSHRKSSDGNDRDVLVLKSITNRNAENTLEMLCWEEELEDVQKNWLNTIQKEEMELQKRLDTLMNLNNANVVYSGELSTIVEVSEQVVSAVKSSQAQSQFQPIILNNNVTQAQNYQLVMDPRLGLIVAGPTVANATATPTTPGTQVYPGKVQVAQNLHPTPAPPPSASTTTSGRGMRTRRGGGRNASPAQRAQSANMQSKQQATPSSTPTKITALQRNLVMASSPAGGSSRSGGMASVAGRAASMAQRNALASQQQQQQQQQQIVVGKKTTAQASASGVTVTPVAAAASSSAVPRSTRFARDGLHQCTITATNNVRPTETNVEGGLSTSSASNTNAKKVIDLTNDDNSGRSAPDSREISFNKLQGKTYPSLVVVARPHLRAQDASIDRPKLDAKVKAVLMHAPTRFTEWLIQQALVRSEQRCSMHPNMKMKLGMYSDVSKFPYSGGYVWISECCPQKFVSVFNGSLFEGSPHPPMVILKLIYHWACQTNIQNVTQWVKVDNLFVKGMFTWLRASCTVALHTHLRQLGGPGIKVEVGVISLGTTSQDGNQRQVKVEVLGILETPSKLIRLRAVEPSIDNDRNYKKRFSKILEPIQQWVHPQSILVADLTVDKQTLHNMGFDNVVQSSNNADSHSNRQIMEYLRRIVPRMFQNTLSLLSRQIIQQFLDELVWREWFGASPLAAFDNIVVHLADQTRYESGQSLLVRLNKVAQNPFRNWAIPDAKKNNDLIPPPPLVPQPQHQSVPSNQVAQKKTVSRSRKSNNANDSIQKNVQQVPSDSRPPKSTSPDVPEQMVPLENYYYGTIDTYSKTPSVILNIKCPFCKVIFNNNIQLMNHLFKHAHNVSQDAQLCRYCLSSVPTASDLLKHIASSHPGETKFDNGFICLICETQYMNPFVLGKHMSKEHCPSELPYQCGTCGYRCSNHKQAIDHFYRLHNNGPTIQCPFCLKSTTVFSSSRNIVQNINYFIQHLQKHQRKQLAKRCGKCNLWFVQKDVLKEHQTRMHVSQRGKTGMVPWSAPRNGVMVPKSKMDKYPCDAEVINFSTLSLNISKNLICKECSSPMDTPKHFPSFESCQNPNCQYSTCCSNAMQVHNAKCNKLSNPVAESRLPFEMFCICGFSDKDGNKMARHLAICERKSAYPSRADAKAATVTHSMLDVLGLVRKPEENSSNVKKKIIESDGRGLKRKIKDDPEKPIKKRKDTEEPEEIQSSPDIHMIVEETELIPKETIKIDAEETADEHKISNDVNESDSEVVTTAIEDPENHATKNVESLPEVESITKDDKSKDDDIEVITETNTVDECTAVSKENESEHSSKEIDSELSSRETDSVVEYKVEESDLKKDEGECKEILSDKVEEKAETTTTSDSADYVIVDDDKLEEQKTKDEDGPTSTIPCDDMDDEEESKVIPAEKDTEPEVVTEPNAEANGDEVKETTADEVECPKEENEEKSPHEEDPSSPNVSKSEHDETSQPDEIPISDTTEQSEATTELPLACESNDSAEVVENHVNNDTEEEMVETTTATTTTEKVDEVEDAVAPSTDNIDDDKAADTDEKQNDETEVSCIPMETETDTIGDAVASAADDASENNIEIVKPLEDVVPAEVPQTTVDDEKMDTAE